MARDKALYHGHAIAAVAATFEEIASHTLDLIDVEYEMLTHVLNLDDALASNAPLLDDTQKDDGTPSNIALRNTLERGNA